MGKIIIKTIGQSLGKESLEKYLCILGVPQIRAGAYSFLLKKFFLVSIYIKKVVVKLHISRLVLH